MFQESEIINLNLVIISVFILVVIFRNQRIPMLRYFYAGFFFIACANFFTVIESILWQEFFNILEHLSLAVSGIAFAYGCLLLSRLRGNQL